VRKLATPRELPARQGSNRSAARQCLCISRRVRHSGVNVIAGGAVTFEIDTVLALRTITATLQRAPHPPEEHLGAYTLSRKLEGGLRAEVWLGLPWGSSAPDDAVLIKRFFPHQPGSALDGLTRELALARTLDHDNIVRTLAVGLESGRHFSVSEYLEGMTLRAVLRRANVASSPLGNAAVARVLLALIQALVYAEGQAASAPVKLLVHHLVAAEDVFVTYDGAVKLLGFKSRLSSQDRCVDAASAEDGRAERYDATAAAAVNALLSEHSTAELRAILATVKEMDIQPRDRPQKMGQALSKWQREQLRSDGRAELAAVMGKLFPRARLEQRAWLEAGMARRDSHSTLEDAAPVSGFRRIEH
jgi:serine/threonine protein kinase